jgi:hypothetical protein
MAAAAMIPIEAMGSIRRSASRVYSQQPMAAAAEKSQALAWAPVTRISATIGKPIAATASLLVSSLARLAGR